MNLVVEIQKAVRRQFEAVADNKPGEIVVLPKSPTPALVDARWRFQQAVNAIPRDQTEINRLRRIVEALERPADGLSELHRRGRIR